MATAVRLPLRYTPDEYLALEEKAEFRSEYVAGQICAKSGAALPHAQIGFNLAGVLRPELSKGERCQGVSPDMKVWMPRMNTFAYPDLQIVCGKPRLRENRSDVLENPSVVFEILSDSTEKYDRGRKFHAYQTIPELRHYVLISQDQPMVEVFTKGDDVWCLTTFRGLHATADLPAIDVRLPLAGLYENVEFTPVEELPGDSEPERN